MCVEKARWINSADLSEEDYHYVMTQHLNLCMQREVDNHVARLNHLRGTINKLMDVKRYTKDRVLPKRTFSLLLDD